MVPENAPIITYGVGSRAMLVSGARHHYGNTEAGRLSDATTRRRRTERADTADVTSNATISTAGAFRVRLTK